MRRAFPTVKSASGFTLVELIIIIVLISILAVTAAPRIFTADEVQPTLVKQQLISVLQAQQQRALNDTVAGSACYGIADDGSDAFEITNCRRGNGSFALEGLSATWTRDGASTPLPLYFNALGCLSDCGVGDIEVTIQGRSSAHLCVRNQGYIESGRCS